MAELTGNAPANGHETGFGSKPYRTYVLGALLVAYIFNFIDRIMIGILAEPIIEHFNLKDWQFGLLSGLAFAAFYTFLGIPMARLSERVSRVWIIGVSIIIWSLMTALCGLAWSFLALFLFRLGVGVGEAGLTPAANSLISDYFKPRSRAPAIAIYAMGVTVGTLFANLFVGLFGNQVDWQDTFITIGLAGIPLGIIIILTIKEPPRGYTDPPGAVRPKTPSIGETLQELGGKYTFWAVTVGAMLASFVGYGMGNFIISYLMRNHGIALGDAALHYMAPLSVAGAAGTFFCGWLIEKLDTRHKRASLWLPAGSFVVAAFAYAAAFNAPSVALIFPLLLVANLFHYWYLGPMYSIVGAVVGARSRATAIAILLFVVNLLGYGLGPLFVGLLSDIMAGMKLAGQEGLSVAICKSDAVLSEAQEAVCAAASADGIRLSITVTVMIFLLAALCYISAMRSYKRDLVSG